MRFSPNPLWSRAPFGLFRFRALFASIAGAGSLLVLAVVVAPLFLSATANGGLRDALRDVGPFGGGFSVVQNDAIAPKYRQNTFFLRTAALRRQNFEQRDQALSATFAGVDGIGDRVATVVGDEIVASSPTFERGLPVRPIARTGASGQIELISSEAGAGVFLPDIIAEELRVEPGDDLKLGAIESADKVMVRVKGIYRALSEAPLTPYWQSLENEIQLELPIGILPPPFVIASQAQTTEIIKALTPSSAQFRWEFPLADPTSMTVAEARMLARKFDHVTTQIGRSVSPLGKLFSCHCFYRGSIAQVNSQMDGAVRSAVNREAGLKAPLALISNAGALIALALLGAAAAYEIYRRRTEFVYLMTRGVSPMLIGGRATLEAILPAAVGGAIGFLGARWLINVVLSGAAPDGAAATEANHRLSLAALAGALIFWAASSIASDRRMRKASDELHRGFAPLWELPVIGLALYGLFSVLHKESLIGAAGGARAISSSLILLFPLALIGGISGLVARVFKRVLGRARRRSRGWSDGPHLAVHRLAAAPQLAVLLFSACGLALGTLVYSQTTGATIQANATTKAFVFVGSNVSAPVNAGYELPASFPFPSTEATQIVDRASIDGDDVDVLAVDSTSIARAAYWNDSFSDESIEEVSATLHSSRPGELTVASTESLDAGSSLEIGGAEIPIESGVRLQAFPGMVAGRNLVVVDSEDLRNRLTDAGGLDVISGSGSFTSVWIKGDPDAVEEALLSQGFPREDILTTADVLDQPVFLAIRRSFAFLQVLGLASSLIVIVGLVLYLQARQAQRTLSLALAGRMGLTGRAHRAALSIELGTMLVIALVVGGTVGIGVSSLLFKRLDPLPSVAPTPSLFLPVTVGLALIATLCVLTIAGAFAADNAARRASITEVLRYE